MTLPKQATCKFNLNRDSYKIVRPYCVWGEEALKDVILPPHFGIQKYEVDLERYCRKCEAYMPYKGTFD